MKLQDFDFRIWDGKKYLKQKIYNDNINNNEYIAVTGNVDDENYVLTIEHSYESNYYGGDYDEYCKVKDFTSCNYEIELFTGLYDKNGKKIYEGDILRIQLDYNKVEKGFVQYHNGIFKVINRKASQASHEYCVTFLEICYIKDCVEIIGNIHENAELLK
ncbi:TPA: YopX family protein [Campylobacter jejuni]